MPAQQQHTTWTAFVSATAGDVEVGHVLMLDAQGRLYLIANTAGRTASGRSNAAGIALTARSAEDTDRSVEIQVVGPCPPSVTHLETGSDDVPIIIDTDGFLVRSASPGVDDIAVGKCDSDGWAYLNFSVQGTAGPPGPAGTQIPGGNKGNTQFHSTTDTFAGAPIAIPFEYFGGIGDNSTNNATALAAFITAATAAQTANRPIMLELGAGTYVVNSGTYLVPAGGIKGQGRGASAFRITHDAVFLQCNQEGTSLSAFTITGDNGDHNQVGIRLGDTANSIQIPSNVTIDNVRVASCYYGLKGEHRSDVVFKGAVVSNCEFYDAAYGVYLSDRAEYLTFVNCTANHNARTNDGGAGVGVWVGSGNITWTGGNITENVYGVWLEPGTNDSHGAFIGAQINHNTKNIHARSVANTHRFIGCNIYGSGGDIELVGSQGIEFRDCTIDVAALTFDGSLGTLFTNCKTLDDYSTVVTDNANSHASQTTFRECFDHTGNILSWVASRIQVAFTFATDADATLTLQQATAETIVVADGVTTASRALSVPHSPANEKGSKRRFVNDNSHDLTVKFSSGASVTVPAQKWALIGSDGTDAIVLESPGPVVDADIPFSYTTTGDVGYEDALVIDTSAFEDGTYDLILRARGDAGNDGSYTSGIVCERRISFGVIAGGAQRSGSSSAEIYTDVCCNPSGPFPATADAQIEVPGASVVNIRVRGEADTKIDWTGEVMLGISLAISNGAGWGGGSSPPPTISSLSLDQVDTSGGDALTIVGTNLTDATVDFNGVAATVVTPGDTSMVVTLPNVTTGGTYNVTVTTAGGSASSALEAWDPRAASAVFWLRADKGVTLATGKVSAWADQSGAGDSNRNATQGTGANQPTFNAAESGYNNRDTVGPFTSNGQCLNTGTWSASFSTFTYALVGHTAANGYFAFSQESDYCAPCVSVGGAATAFAGSGGASSISDSAGIATAKAFFMTEFNGSSSKTFLNATGTATATGTLSASTLGNEAVRIGSYNTGSSGAFGVTRIAELMAFSGQLSAGNKIKLRKYINLRYAKTMST